MDFCSSLRLPCAGAASLLSGRGECFSVKDWSTSAQAESRRDDHHHSQSPRGRAHFGTHPRTVHLCKVLLGNEPCLVMAWYRLELLLSTPLFGSTSSLHSHLITARVRQITLHQYLTPLDLLGCISHHHEPFSSCSSSIASRWYVCTAIRRLERAGKGNLQYHHPS